MTINNTIRPPGGYAFVDRDRVTFRAPSFDTLVKVVTAYRERAGFPAGNPTEEIAEQMCKRYPPICRPPAKEKATKGSPTPVPPSPRGLVIRWLAGIRKVKQAQGALGQRDATEVSRRIEICRGCPQRTILTTGCSVCGEALGVMRADVLGRKPADSDLGACLILNCDLPTAVHLDEAALDNSALPVGCWRKVAAP